MSETLETKRMSGFWQERVQQSSSVWEEKQVTKRLGKAFKINNNSNSSSNNNNNNNKGRQQRAKTTRTTTNRSAMAAAELAAPIAPAPASSGTGFFRNASGTGSLVTTTTVSVYGTHLWASAWGRAREGHAQDGQERATRTNAVAS